MTERYIGSWSIARSIADDETETIIDCTGRATLYAHDGALAYDEAVAYELAGKPIRATRAYRFASAGGAIVATFSDGRPFFALALDADGVGRAHHRCGADRYDLTVTLREPDRWQTRWDVSGTTRLRIVSRYSRT
jgi:hypothetical protein